MGIGRSCSLNNLKKSYLEANDALDLGWLMGKRNSIIRYSELGIFSLLLELDRSMLAKYCEKQLAGLLNADDHDASLLNTLRQMLDRSFHWADVSKLLFIHVNTLHYRIDRISKLLKADFSRQEVRTNYYITIKLYDLLCDHRQHDITPI
ncbi:MAG: helix-turn-helix domain-containing protein [Coriobacteriales bacterium]|nr:helix-turn-helix domain-containing protein [Coriobacteriales bacterium]